VIGNGSCTYTYTLSTAGFSNPTSIDWNGGSAWDGQGRVQYTFPVPNNGVSYTTSVTVTVRAPDGRTTSASKSVFVSAAANNPGQTPNC